MTTWTILYLFQISYLLMHTRSSALRKESNPKQKYVITFLATDPLTHLSNIAFTCVAFPRSGTGMAEQQNKCLIIIL